MRFLSLLLLLPLGIINPTEALADTQESCANIGWVTDSTGITMFKEGTGKLETAGQTAPFPKAMSEAGVKSIHYDVQGGRSLHERVNNKPNGIEAMKSMGTQPDCFVITMGTNDAANVEAGSNVTIGERINKVMETAAQKPVYWMSPVVLPSTTLNHYSEKGADEFTKALQAKAETSKNLKVIDSKKLMIEAAGKNGLPGSINDFMISDGIHPKDGLVAQHRSQTVRNALQETPAKTTPTAPPSTAVTPKSTKVKTEKSDQEKLQEFLPGTLR